MGRYGVPGARVKRLILDEAVRMDVHMLWSPVLLVRVSAVVGALSDIFCGREERRCRVLKNDLKPWMRIANALVRENGGADSSS